MKVEVRSAGRADRPTVANLLQLYLHDFSEFDGSQISPDGRFRYAYLPEYWQKPDRHPFLIFVDDQLAGFAFVKQGSELAADEQAMDIAEFFVLRGQRRRGVGRQAFEQIVARFPGPWIVRVQRGVPVALTFWEQVIAQVADREVQQERISDGERDWIVFRFFAAGSVQ